MTATYARHVSTRSTTQTEPISGKPMVPNSAGGYSFAVDDWVRLDRFLVLGNEGGSYYATEKALTIENAKAVQNCLKEDGVRVVNRIVAISEGGRAPKNDPAIFALALAAGTGNEAAKQAAYEALPKVCRIGTHLFQFAESVQEFRGWGRGLRRAIRNWYSRKEPRDLAYQCVKYQQRNGWAHRDLLRLAHPNPGDGKDYTLQERENRAAVLHWIVKGWPEVGEDPHPQEALLPIWAFERAKRATTKQEIVRLIREYRLVRECIPTQFLTDPDVWEALLQEMPLTALIRNLATMTRVGLLAPLSRGTGKVLAELANAERLRKSRVHPISVLAALRTYVAGCGEKSKHTWTPVGQIVDALDGAFYTAYGNVEPTGKRWLLALDVSGSMSHQQVCGMPFMTAVEAEAAMALVTAATEPQHVILAFDTAIKNVTITPRQRLDDATNAVKNMIFGGTNCALPIQHALANRIPVDAFALFTDSETWQGNQHPAQAMDEYRRRMGIPAKLIVVAMAANHFTVGDGADAGTLGIAGFDTAVPQLMAQFATA